MDIYTQLARKTLEEYLTSEKLPETKNLQKELTQKAACFVSLHQKKDDSLRGCIGTIVPVYKNLAAEIIANTVSAATSDPRFPQITKDELKDVILSVDILSLLEQIEDKDKLDPKKYGVVVKTNDGKSGLLLPNIEGVDSIDNQIDIACQKAGILPDEDIFLYRFTTNRHEEI